jgi:hypothetical protein
VHEDQSEEDMYGARHFEMPVLLESVEPLLVVIDESASEAGIIVGVITYAFVFK